MISKISDDLFKLERPILYTDRLILRPFQASDAPMVQTLAGDPKIAATTTNIPHPYPDKLASEWIETHGDIWSRGKTLVYAVCLKQSEELVGTVSLAFYGNRINAELAYWVGVPFWNKGYCSEASQCIINFGFSNLKLNKIKAHHLSENPASGRVMIKNQMVREGVFAEEIVLNARLCDVEVYGVTKTMWFGKS